MPVFEENFDKFENTDLITELPEKKTKKAK